MIIFGGFSVRAFCVGIRWARRNGFPNAIADWNEEHDKKFQEICKYYDTKKRKACKSMT
jgi:hypothetical protein